MPERPDFDRVHIRHALAAAERGAAQGGVPIGGALVTDDGVVLGVGANQRVQKASAILHGETDCLNNVGRMPGSAYKKTTMFTTLSPCPMCTGAIILFGIPRVVIGENETFMGAEDTLRAAGVEVVNLDMADCKALMRKFQQEHPDIWAEDIGQDL